MPPIRFFLRKDLLPFSGRMENVQKEAATVMKITAQDLKELSVVDKVIPEYGGADDDALTSIAAWMKGNMKEFLRAQNHKSGKQFAQERYDRFRKF